MIYFVKRMEKLAASYQDVCQFFVVTVNRGYVSEMK